MTPPEPLTAASLYRRRWYVVPNDEVGGWSVATVDRPTSQIDPMSTRDRVLLDVVWEEHARWIVEAHNAVYPDDPPPPPVDPPNGCRWCGVDYQVHCQRAHVDVGIHGWVAPTDAQRLARMRARRARNRPPTEPPTAD